MKKTNKQIKKETPATPAAAAKKEAPASTCACDSSCNCDSSCGCGCQEGAACSCGCGVSKTTAKCITMLVSATLISASILIASSTCNKARPAVNPNPVIDIKIAEFIKKNPQVIIASLEGYQKVQAEEKKLQEIQGEKQQAADKSALIAKTVKDVIADKSNYSLGNENGKFVIIEFFDYRCGWCKRTNKGLDEAIASGKAKNIRWIPLDAPIFGAGSELISSYVLAAGKQGKYKEMHHAVTAAEGNLDEAALVKLAEGQQLNIEKLKADASSNEIKAKIAANQEITKRLGVQGVPYLIVNGNENSGALIGENLNKAIEDSNK